MITIAQAILSINSKAEVNIKGDNLDTCEIEWMNGTAEISKADIKTKITELQNIFDNNKYQRDRADKYPSIQEQLDMQYWDNVNGTSNWKDAIAKVKSDIPKGA
tara:strand:- start:17 stop:328 length:312 start_codon:yes stop_codon:yes gene_type:complete